VQTTRGDGSLDVKWSAPDWDGGSQLTGYRITMAPGDRSMTVPAGVTSVRFDELVNGTEYAFRVSALNEAGLGEPSGPSAPNSPISQELDSDQDGLPDILEERAGSNVLLADSDFDGLTDSEEVLKLSGLTSPLDPHSNGGDVGDADQDADADGLSNRVELDMGLNPASADSDADGLDDAHEVSSGTDARELDTDADGLSDAHEAELGLDPLVADSDLDGVRDADSSVTRDVSSGDAAAIVEGPAGDAVSVTVETSEQTAVPGAVSVVASITGGSELLSVRSLALTVTPEHPTEERELVVFELAGATWQESQRTALAGAEPGVITIDSPVPETSYTVVDLVDWRAQARVCDFAASDDARLDLEVVLDNRQSIWNADPTNERFTALDVVLDTLLPGDTARLRTFGVEYHYAGGGGLMLVGSHDDGPDVPDVGTSLDQTRTALSEIADGPSPAPAGLEHIDEQLGFTDAYEERALGGLHFEDTRSEGERASDERCRIPAVVLVTNGALVPKEPSPDFPDDYMPFLERTDPPVHVLDVGPGGERAQWLVDVAERTGGSYSHVATAGPWIGWGREPGEAPELPDSMMRDSDGDGLVDWVESFGIQSANSGADRPGVGTDTFRTDPSVADSDGDGMPDGQEVGEPLTPAEMGGWSSPLPVTTYRVVSDPTSGDGDHDDLLDIDELESEELDPLDADPDRDGLLDGGEAEWGTHPRIADTEHDGYDDSAEVYTADASLHPLEVNIEIGQETWYQEFTLGALCGDVELCRRPTIPWLIGSIVSGTLIYGDIRDLVWSLKERNVLNTALVAAGLVPVMGDAVGAGAKIARHLPAIINGPARREAVDLLLRASDDTAQFVEHMRSVSGPLVRRLEGLNIDTDAMARLLLDNDHDELTAVLDYPNLRVVDYAVTGPPKFVLGGRAGEDFLQRLLGKQPTSVREQPLWIGDTKPNGCRGCRYPDITTGSLEEGFSIAEAKVGYVRGPFARHQIAKDRELVNQKVVDEASWHFFASDWSGRIGPSQSVLNLLREANIPIYLHLPRS
jgi:hypothetical protein